MATVAQKRFDAALNRFRRARSRLGSGAGERTADRLVRTIDDALDALLSVPSPSPRAFGTKLRILEAEYGLHVQQRHVAALYRDAPVLEA